MSRPTVVLDACVLIPIRLATTLLWLAEAGLLQPLHEGRSRPSPTTVFGAQHPGVPISLGDWNSICWKKWRSVMHARFTQRDDLVVDIHLPESWRPLEETLQDAVTTRAPRGSDGINPSTFWIDRTLAAVEKGPTGVIAAAGNSTDLVLVAAGLVARSQYEMFDDQHVERAELVDLLQRWRVVVLDLLRAEASTS